MPAALIGGRSHHFRYFRFRPELTEQELTHFTTVDYRDRMAFVALRPWDERPGEENSAATFIGRTMAAMTKVQQALVYSLNPPAITGLGISRGFTLKMQDRGGK